MSPADEEDSKELHQQTRDNEAGAQPHSRQQAQSGNRKDPAGNQQYQACKLH
jgi:hypothetical protein